MKKTHLAALIALIILAIPTVSYAVPVSWDALGSTVLQPLQSLRGATIMGASFTATSTTDASTFLANVGIGTTSPDVPLHIGVNVAQTPDATIMMSRNITGAGNGHGISDETNFNSTNGSYNSFDARAQLYGMGTTPGSHYAAFQARPDFYTGTTIPIYRAYAASSPTVNSGTTITDYYGYIFSGPTIVSGSVTNAYGSYISNIGSGATNKWAYYAVADKSYFGGNVGFGTTTPHSLADFSNSTGEQITISDTNASADQKNWYIESDSGEFQIGTTSDNFTVTPNAFFSIEPSGELGIAQSTPTSILELGGFASDSQGLFESNGTYTASASGVSGGVFESMPTLNLNTAVSVAAHRFDATVNTTVDQTAVYGMNTTLSLGTSANTTTDAIINQLSMSRGAGYTGTTTTLRGYRYIEGTNSGTGVITNQMGLNIAALDDATNNTSILIGNTTAQTGNFGILSAVDYPNVFRASTTDATAAPLVIQGSRAAILTGHSLGNLQFWSNDTNYTSPGLVTAGIGALAEGTHTGSVAPTALTFSTASTGLVPTERMRLSNTGNLGIASTSPFATLSVTNTGTNPSFIVEDATSPDITQFVISAAGDVGIGTTTPTAKFEVLGVVSGKILSLFTSTGTRVLEILNSGVVLALGVWNFGDATSFEVVNGTAPVVDDVGETALDTTDNQFLVATSTDAAWPGVFRANSRLFSFKVASTSMGYASTSMVLPPEKDGFTVTSISCRVEGGTSVVINLSDANGTNDTNTVTCNTGNANTAITSNYTWTAGEELRLEWGTKTGTIDWVNVSVFGTWTRE